MDWYLCSWTQWISCFKNQPAARCRRAACEDDNHNDGDIRTPVVIGSGTVKIIKPLMSSQVNTSNRIRQTFRFGWRLLAASYAHVNRLTHHALGWVLMAVLVGYFLFCGVFLSLRYVVLPNIDHYKPEVEKVASYFVARPVTIKTIHASWRGLHPSLRLNDVVIHNQQGDPALVLPEVSATLSWWSVLAGELSLYTLEVSRPDLEIERDEQGHIFIAGLLLDTDKPSNGRGLDWLLSQREIVIRNGWVRWLDKQRGAPPMVLTNVDFLLQNKWRSHRVALKATPPAELAAPIDLRAAFTHPAFVSRRSDFTQWSGELYADWRNTNLESWKQYVDYPFELSGGRGAIRAWINFDRGVVHDFAADLGLSDLTVRLDPQLSPLKLVEVSGRIAGGEVAAGLKQQLLSFGDHGHTLELSNFSLRTDQGTVLPSTTVSSTFTAAKQGRLEQHELKISALDLDTLAQLARHLPLSNQERQMLADFAPKGAVQDFSAQWEGSTPGTGNYRLRGKFSDLALQPQPARAAVAGNPAQSALPGFEGLSGQVDLNQQGGNVELNSAQSTLYLADYFPDPVLPFDALALRASWSLRERNHLTVKIGSMQFSQSGLKGSLEGTHVLPLPFVPDKLGELDLNVHVPSVELSKVARFLPSVTPALTRDWVAGALIDGRAHDVHILVKGDLDKFPFQPKHSADRPTGLFKITAKIENGKLSPAFDQLAQDKRTPLWPKIEDIRGDIMLDRTLLHIHADSAKTNGVALAAVEAIVPDYWSANSVLDVSGSANGALQSMVAYANSTPVAGWTEGFTEQVRATGNAKLNLKMQLPLGPVGQPTVQGTLRLMSNDVQLTAEMPMLQQAVGELSFSEKGFQLTGVQGNFLGGPVQLGGGTQRDVGTLIKLDGLATSDGVARSLSSQTVRRLAKKLSGSARYSASLRIKNQRPELNIESSLAGLAMDLPAPLNKTANETMPLRFSLAPINVYDPFLHTEEIRIALGKTIAARYIRQRSVNKNMPWKMVRGGIGVNQPVPQPDSGLSINLNLPSLNVDSWRSTVASVLNEPGAADNATEAGATDLSAYVTPDTLGMRASKLIVADKSLANALLGATRQRGSWQVNIHSDQAVGHATWNDPSSERGAGKITARLVSLIIPDSTASDMTDLLSGKSASTQLPGLDIVADQVELKGIKLGRVELSASNAGMDLGREWRISRLVVTNPDGILRANGKWSVFGGNSQSGLTYELEITDAGRMLDRFGFARLLKGGKGRMDGELTWKGAPYAFDIPTLSGTLNLRLASGQFLKGEPGVAKLLGVMSLQSLPRRLVLDFRDLFSEGFAFDSIASAAAIQRGVIKTDSFKMRGVNAVVLMDGTVDLTDETQNLNLVVIPELNAGGASVVYGLAVNPVVGLGSFLAQLFLRNPLSQALTQEYQVTGPWADPAVKKLPTRRKEIEPADATPRN